MKQEDFYTIVQPDGKEIKLGIEYDDIGGHDNVPAKPVTLSLHHLPAVVTVNPQQLTELGALFLALAGSVADYSAADSLLEGFSLKGKEAATKLAEALEE